MYKNLANNLFKKLVLLRSVRYAVTYPAVTVKNYCFTQCSVLINVISNTRFGSVT
jgi:hypothetical protein